MEQTNQPKDQVVVLVEYELGNVAGRRGPTQQPTLAEIATNAVLHPGHRSAVLKRSNHLIGAGHREQKGDSLTA
jgi:hypothetical protein